MRAEQTAYEIIGVDPCAPVELVAAVYWMAAGQLQAERDAGKPVDDLLHSLTRAYESVSTPERRAHYDELIGNWATPVISRKLSHRRTIRHRLLRRPQVPKQVNYYEILGLAPDTSNVRIHEAHRIMRDHYLKAPVDSQRRLLMQLLDDARATLTDEQRRAEYDRKHAGRTPEARLSAVSADSKADVAQDSPAGHATAAPAVAQPAAAAKMPAESGHSHSATPAAANGSSGSILKPVGTAATATFGALAAVPRSLGGLVRSAAHKLAERSAGTSDGSSPAAEAPLKKHAPPATPHRRESDEDVERALIERLAVRVDDAEHHKDAGQQL